MMQSSLRPKSTVRPTHKRQFLDAVESAALWAELVSLIEPYAQGLDAEASAPLQCRPYYAYI